MINQSVRGGSLVWLKPKFGKPKEVMVSKVLADSIFISDKRLEPCSDNSFALGKASFGTVYASEQDYLDFLEWNSFASEAFYLNLSNEQKKQILEIVRGC